MRPAQQVSAYAPIADIRHAGTKPVISCASALHQQGLFCAVRDSRSEAVS
jgi:hypothetical protein